VRRAGLGVNGGRSVVAAAGRRGIDGGGATGSFVITASSRRGVPERSEAQRRQGRGACSTGQRLSGSAGSEQEHVLDAA
jgi:hypothetical protein